MWFLFLPLGLLFIVLFVLGSAVAGLFALHGAALPVLLIGLGLWMFLHQGGRRHAHAGQGGESYGFGGKHGCSPRFETHGAVPPTTGEARQHETREDRKRRRADLRARNELPIELQVKVEQIRRKVDVLLGYADRFSPFSKELYLVRQTAADYLPRTIQAFLALPVEQREAVVATDGRTAYAELKGQLELLDSRLDEIAQDLQRQDADRLLANRRFLESRFGQHKDPLDVV